LGFFERVIAQVNSTPNPAGSDSSANWLTSYHGVTAFLAMLVMMISNGMVLSGLTPFRLDFAQRFGWSMRDMTLADLITFGVVGLLAPSLGGVIDRFGVRKLMMLGGVVLTGAYFCYAHVTTLAQMYAVHALLGVAVALAGLVPVSRLVARWFVQKRGTAMGIALAGSSIASYVFYPWAVALLAKGSYSAAFNQIAWAGLALTALAVLLVRDNPEEKNLRAYGASTQVLNPAELPGVSFEVALRSLSFWCLSLGAAMTFFAMLGTLYNLPAHMVDLGFSRAEAGGGLQAMLTAALVGKFAFGFLSDYLPPKRVYMANLALMALGALALALADRDSVLWASAFFGLGWGGLYTMLQLLAVESFGMRAIGRIMGVIAIFDAVGGGLGSFVMGAIKTQTGGYHAAFYLMFGMIVLGLLAATQIRKLPQS
jgi:MFS family permease